MKKLTTILVSLLFLLITFTSGSSVFAEANNNLSKESTEGVVTAEYELVPAFTNSNVSTAGLSGGSATVTCRDAGHGIAHCDTKYALYNDKISSVSTTVYIYMPGGIYVDSDKQAIFHGGISGTVYDQSEMIVGSGTFYSELWGTVNGLKGPYQVTNIASRNFTVD
ncbi:hypothetical protein B0G93_10675 [Bacillus sp. V-88]|nr:hypothetical protein B1B00_08605 [Bacillus sp. DSM 27956]PRX77042.1 hypothetical protein B0G93_10675 [Bacillus sp. V-88]SLK21149.1 hypothetical protein SAMN06295884_10675 [Bacillus sp. V-88]